MITVVENNNDVVGIFTSHEDVENYLIDHPEKEKCLIKDLNISKFPFYIAEPNYGEFIYFSTKDELFNYFKEVNIEEVGDTRYVTIASFRIDDNGNSVNCGADHTQIIVYTVTESCSPDNKNQYVTDSFYHTSIGIETFIRKTENDQELLKKAEVGDAKAQYELGEMYAYLGSIIPPEDYKKALEWYTKAASQGHDRAQFNLGSMYCNGDGVRKNRKKALEWYTKAASQGNERAQNNLGWMYFEGDGVPKDYEKAFEWTLKAANQGFAEAQYELGNMYRDGYGVPQDYEKAFEWYTKAVNQGHTKAKHALVKPL